MMIIVGCCGYPRARQEYYQHFGAVEIQQTFYRLPQISTAMRWAQEAPPGFIFTMKAWQVITHEATSPTYRRSGLTITDSSRYGSFRPTPDVRAAWEQTCAVADALHARAILLQCPASFTPTEEHLRDLRSFLRVMPRGSWALAWEPRGDWPDEVIRVICHEFAVIHATDPFVRRPLAGRPAYLRLHGRGSYRYRYTDDDLAQLATLCRDLGEVYVFFNNISMWDDAKRFQGLVG
jgi:uncharacterized protein YecE (DUF72 family)